MKVKVVLPSCTWVKDLNSAAVEKIKSVLDQSDCEYEFEVINDLQKALELNIINPPAVIINDQKVFEKRWPSESQLKRIIELMK